MSLWVDLADVLVWYRTVIERLGKLKGPARRSRLSVTASEIDQLIDRLNGAVLSQLSADPLRLVVSTVEDTVALVERAVQERQPN
jgi:hypothetical protein